MKDKFLTIEEVEKITNFKRRYFQRRELEKMGITFKIFGNRLLVERENAEKKLGCIDNFIKFLGDENGLNERN